MDELHALPSRRKISPAVLARLAKSKPTQKLRAIDLLNTMEPGVLLLGTSSNRNERQAIVDEVRSQASKALPKIDIILTRFDGRRLSETPPALGTIAIERTPAGIAALSESDYVNAILQDQPISGVV